jgi:hypothetical protein
MYHHQAEHENKKYIYADFMEMISQNITVHVRTWVYRTWEEIPWE